MRNNKNKNKNQNRDNKKKLQNRRNRNKKPKITNSKNQKNKLVKKKTYDELDAVYVQYARYLYDEIINLSHNG